MSGETSGDQEVPVVLVTGAGGWLGTAIVRSLAERTTTLVANDVDEDALGLLVGSLPDIVAVPGDVSDPDIAQRLVDEVTASLGPVDVVVNVAGIEGPVAAVEDLDPAEVERVFAVNVFAIFWLAAAIVPRMKERRRGRIVNIASGAGLAGGALVSPYHASKHAVVGFTRSLARELAPHNVVVNAVCPGFVDSPMVERILDAEEALTGLRPDVIPAIPMARMAEPDEVAATVSFLALDAPTYLTGSSIVLDGALRA